MQYKGSGLMFLKKQLQKRGDAAEEAFLSKLTSEEARYYRETLAFQWAPIEIVNKCYVHGAAILYSGEPHALRRLGSELARDQMPTLYRMIARVMSVPALMEQSARIWHTYHAKGTAYARKSDLPNEVHFFVEGYPELPERFRECICGFLAALVEMSGEKDVKVFKSSDAPARWEWTLVWHEGQSLEPS